VIAVDCVNAFNSVDRRAILRGLLALPQVKALLPLFSLLYAEESCLFWHDGNTTELLKSTKGTRQGDVLGPALFCVALHPILQEVQLRFPDVELLAFIDDVSICGPAIEVGAAFDFLRDKLAEIGLTCNQKKTKALGPQATDLADALGIVAAHEGCKILGTHVGPLALEQDWMHQQLLSHDPLFERIRLLQPDVALAVLRWCAHPRWNYITRTTPNSRGASLAFDERVGDTFCFFAGIKRLAEHEAHFLHLPVQQGGCGLRRYALLCDEAYASSLDMGSDSQATRAARIDERIAQLLDATPFLASLRAANKSRHSGLWLQLRINNESPSKTFRRVDFALALQLRIGHNPFLAQPASDSPLPSSSSSSKTAAVCDGCGTLLTDQLFDHHVLGCAKRQAPNAYLRHNSIRDTLSSWCRRRGITVVADPPVGSAGEKADLAVYLENSVLCLDFVCVSTLAPSCPSIIKAQKKKDKKYAPASQAGLVPVIPGALAVMGGMSNQLSSALRHIAVAGNDDPFDLIWAIAMATAKANGAILRVARCRAGLKTDIVSEFAAVDDDDDEVAADDDDEVVVEEVVTNVTPSPPSASPSSASPSHPVSSDVLSAAHQNLSADVGKESETSEEGNGEGIRRV
jgi:hypothetical protein